VTGSVTSLGKDEECIQNVQTMLLKGIKELASADKDEEILLNWILNQSVF